MVEQLLAGVLLAVCLVMLLRMALKPHQRARMDVAWARFKGRLQRLRQPRAAPPARRMSAEDAGHAAEEAIRRAREGQWDGNVYRPKSFRRPKKPH